MEAEVPPTLEYARSRDVLDPGGAMRIAAGIVWAGCSIVAGGSLMIAVQGSVDRDDRAVLFVCFCVAAAIACIERMATLRRSATAASLIAAAALVLALLSAVPSIFVLIAVVNPKTWGLGWLDSPAVAAWVLTIMLLPWTASFVACVHASYAVRLGRRERANRRERDETLRGTL